MKKPSEAKRAAQIRKLYDERHKILRALRSVERRIDRLELAEQAERRPWFALRGGR